MSRSPWSWLGFGLGNVALLLAVLLIAAPFNRTIALFDVFLQEKSLWFVLLSVTALGAGLWKGRPGIWRWLVLLDAVVSAAAFLWPTYEAFRLAREGGIELSLERYLRSGIEGGGDVPLPETRTYLSVDGRDLKLDVYRRPGVQNQRALIVVHGGGWTAGSRSELPHTNLFFRDHGLVVFDIEYRLAPPANWRAATGDVKCAIGWVRAHAGEWGVDPDRITLLGRSAGGHLALLAAYAFDDPQLPPSCDAPDTRVDSVVALYPPVDLAWGHAHPNNEAVYDGAHRLEQLLDGPPAALPDRYTLMSPLSHIREGTPPTLTLHGEADAFVSPQHSRFLDERLKALGVRHRAVFIPYAQHGFDHIYGGWSSQLAEAETLKLIQTLGVARVARPKPQ